MRIWIVLLIVGLVAVLISVLYLIIPRENAKEAYQYSKIKDNLKTGDIILFSSKNNGNLIQSTIYWTRTRLVGSEYGHVGIVIRTEDGLYLAECCNAMHAGHDECYHMNKQGNGGVRIISLDTIIERYHREYGGFFAVKPIKEELSSDVVISSLNKYQESIFEDINFMYYVAMLDTLVSKDIAKTVIRKYRSNMFDPHRMTCGEFLYNILTDCGVTKSSRSKLVWPHVYVGNRFTKLSNGAYDYHHMFIYDGEQEST